MEYRIHEWLDVKAKLPHYGIQAKYDGKWMHCHENGNPLIYHTLNTAENKLYELRDKDKRGF